MTWDDARFRREQRLEREGKMALGAELDGRFNKATAQARQATPFDEIDLAADRLYAAVKDLEAVAYELVGNTQTPCDVAKGVPIRNGKIDALRDRAAGMVEIAQRIEAVAQDFRRVS